MSASVSFLYEAGASEVPLLTLGLKRKHNADYCKDVYCACYQKYLKSI
jgi:hypothetical protein